MAWSYSGSPSASPKDEVRFLIGDTNPADQELQDAEINYCLALVWGDPKNAPAYGNYLAAAHAADNLASLYARQADKSVGDLHIAYGNRFKQFQLLAQRLRARATNHMVPAWAGGEHWSDKWNNYLDRDLLQGAVKVDGMNYAGGLSDSVHAAYNPEDEPGIGP